MKEIQGKEGDQLPRKERERERHRHEIVKAAERIFARKGFHAATIEEIAKEAEFSVGTLYSFFKSKDELYSCVIEGFVRQFLGEFEERVLAIEDPVEAIGSLIRLRLTHFDEHREFIRIALEAAPCSRVDPSRSLPPQLREMHDKYLDDVTRIFAAGIAQGRFDKADPLYFTLALEGIMHAFIAYWSRHGPLEPLELRVAKMKREFLGRISLHPGRDWHRA